MTEFATKSQLIDKKKLSSLVDPDLLLITPLEHPHLVKREAVFFAVRNSLFYRSFFWFLFIDRLPFLAEAQLDIGDC